MATPVDRLFALLDREVERSRVERSNQGVSKKAPGPRNPNSRFVGADAKRRLALLRAARNVLTNSNWVQAEIAVDADGKSCRADDPAAVGFCLDGALQRAAYKTGTPGSQRSMKMIASACRSILRANGVPESAGMNAILQVADMNDNQFETKAQVIAAINKAIAYEEKRYASTPS